MRINKYIAFATGLSRRKSDDLVESGRIKVDNILAKTGQDIKDESTVTLDGKVLSVQKKYTTIMLNKPTGYVCSRQGQGSRTVYDLLPAKYHSLKPIGRLDKESSGILLFTDNGDLANEITHPRYQKEKVYQVSLNKTLEPHDKTKLLTGVSLSDGMSKFINIKYCSNNMYEIALAEGRNRQIRRTLNSLGYKTTALHRTKFGPYDLENLKSGQTVIV
jgi:23S rRNA pseudouridine2605 synthase